MNFVFMFKSERKYRGLDDFFSTTSSSSLNEWKNIENRINEIDSKYKDWCVNLWSFTSDDEEKQYLINDVHDTIDMMRSSAINYIIGDFNSSIQSSSAAVEKLGNVIMYLEFLKFHPRKTFSSIQNCWIPINTVYGLRYYDKKWNRVVKRDNQWTIFKHSMLSSKMLNEIHKSGYPSVLLLNQGDNFDNSIFIGRRNAAAHGDFSRILIEEQMHGYTIKDPNDLIKLINNKDASLDQYSKASDFIVEAFKIFDQRYP